MLAVSLLLIRLRLNAGVTSQHRILMHGFRVTRRTIATLDPWVAELVALHLPLRKEGGKGGSYYWRFRDENAHALLIGKLVRTVTGLRASLACADAGYTTETLTLLRVVSDCADEVIAIAEGLIEGRLKR